MKDKILFWLETGSPHLGIAKYLSENHDCDLFSIVSTNSGKEFFKKQNIIKFIKTWYLRDNVIKTNKKPDLQYLSSFEKKYQINLWTVAYSDVIFSKYNKFYNFTENEILYTLEQICRFFENIVDSINPDFLIIRPTDACADQLLQLICKSKKIEILTVGATRFGYRSGITTDWDILDKIDPSVDYNKYPNRTKEELINFMTGYDIQQSVLRKRFQGSKIDWIKASLRYFKLISNTEYQKYYAHSGRTVFRVILIELLSKIRKIYRKRFIDKYSHTDVDSDEKFVYFPLGLEPERTILVPAPFYSNQLEAIKNVAKSLPVDYMLYVKEHPMQKVWGWRSTSYYKEISKLQNVRLVNTSVPNGKLVQNCSLVVSVLGTPALEAAFREKPSIVFGDVLFDSLPSVLRVQNLEDLPKLIKTGLNTKVNLSDVNKFVNMIEKNSFEYDDQGFISKICDRFFYSGYLYDVNIPVSEMTIFLEENKKIYNLLGNQHLKKIHQSKNQKLKNS
jgi:hypothetical protein